MRRSGLFILNILFYLQGSTGQTYYDYAEFAMGADLSYVNHIQDRGAEWRENGRKMDPYELFASHGGNVARFRIWHTPDWVEQAYINAGETETRTYHDFYDVKEAISRCKAAGLAVCLDFHYSDTWADPDKQYIPAAWEGLSFDQVKDSLYEYTFKTLSSLDASGLMPEFVQVGNEINSGFIHPYGIMHNREDSLAILLNSAVRGVRDAGNVSDIKPRVIIHIAQPEYVSWWFGEMIPSGLSDFDIIGFSYYAEWSDVPLREISQYVSNWKSNFGKEVMCVETSYLWQTEGDTLSEDEAAQMEPDFYPSVVSQMNYLLTLTEEIIAGGGKGIMPWEPFFVGGHDMITPWGRGLNRQNSSFFNDHMRNEVLPSIDYMNYPYEGLTGTYVSSDSVNINIRLDTGDISEPVDSFYIEGSLTGGSKTLLAKTGNGIYEQTFRLPVNSFQRFRFYYGDQVDNLPETARTGNASDRDLWVPGRSLTLEYTFNGDGDDPSLASSKKNVLLIVVDDLRPELGCYGNDLALTPHIDQIASKGIQFNSNYSQYPECSYSRTSFLSGLRPETTGASTIDSYDPGHVTMPDLFKQNGYYTASVGKIYQDGEEDRDGWDYSWNNAPWQGYGNQDLYDLSYDPVVEYEDLPDSLYPSGMVTLEAIRLLREHREEPFFIAAGFWKPHLPFAAPVKYWDYYERDSIPACQYPDAPAGKAPVVHTWTELAGFHPYEWLDTVSDYSTVQLNDEQAAELRHGYLACVSFIDAQVGMLTDELEALGLARNTIVAFCSDHGFHLGNQTVWGKHTLYEQAGRVPLIIYDPAAGFLPATTDRFTELVDVYPTLAEICGLPEPPEVDGTSLYPLLEDPAGTWHPNSFSMYRSPETAYAGIYGQSLRTREYRYTEWQDYENDRTPVYRELYKISVAGNETENLIGTPGYVQIADSLAKILNDSLENWYNPQEVVDSVDITFQVDMRGETVSDEGVYIYGDFYGWGPRMPMEKICDSVWTKTLRLKPQYYYMFRFFNGYGWDNSEIPPDECRVGDKNRPFTTPGQDGIYLFRYNLCEFEQCDSCGLWICDTCNTGNFPPELSSSRYDIMHIDVNLEHEFVRVLFQDDATGLFIYDMNGRRVYMQPLFKDGSVSIEVCGWQRGVYLMVVTNREKILATKKFILP